MIVLWMLFFFQYAAIGVYYTFLNVYLSAAGLSGTEIGVINMATAMISVATSVLWGNLSDRTGNNRLIIALGAAVGMLVVQAIPYVQGFWMFMLISCLSAFFGSAPGTLVDSTALTLLGDRREEYGRYRLGGSFGYIITAFSAGFLVEWFGMTVIFPAYGLVMAGFAITGLMLPRVIRQHNETPAGETTQAKGGIGKLIRLPAWIVFTVCVFLVWIATNASIMFLSVSLNALGAEKSMIGMISTIPAIVEIPFMLYSGYLLRRFGPVSLLMIGMALMILRYFLLGFMPDVSWALWINPINGPAFVFFWTAAVNYVNRMAPVGYANTAQGMLTSTTSLAGVVSSLLTGWLFDQLGPSKLFVVMAFFCLAALLLFALSQWLRQRRQLAMAAAHATRQ